MRLLQLLAVPAHQQTDRVNPYGLHLGNRLPAHATSAGKILLAHLELNEQLEWLRSVSATTTNQIHPYRTMRTFLELYYMRFKAIDWCYSCEEHELGVHALQFRFMGSRSKGGCSLKYLSPLPCAQPRSIWFKTYCHYSK